jgi:hypothetical protein
MEQQARKRFTGFLPATSKDALNKINREARRGVSDGALLTFLWVDFMIVRGGVGRGRRG